MAKRKGNQKQIWADADFIVWLKQLKAKKELSGEPISNLGELTRQIVHSPAIADVEKQLLKDQSIAEIKIKLDAKRLFQ